MTETEGFPAPDEAGTRLAEALAPERERLGRIVRETWMQWASEQDEPKPSWLDPWEKLGEGQREVDMRIGEAVAAAERERIAGEAARLTVALGRQSDAAKPLEDLAREIAKQDTLHPSGYPYTRDGIRLGIAAIEDETREVWDAWHEIRHTIGNGTADPGSLRGELIQVAAVYMRIARTIDEHRRHPSAAPAGTVQP